MARRARIPEIGMTIFPRRALLEKELTAAVENEEVDGAMSQVIPMHFRARTGPDHTIVFVHDGERLGEVCSSVCRVRWPDKICQPDPLFQRQLFRPRLRPGCDLRGCARPVHELFAEQFAQLLSSLRKTLTHQQMKKFGIMLGQLSRRSRR